MEQKKTKLETTTDNTLSTQHAESQMYGNALDKDNSFEKVEIEEPELFDAEDTESPWKIYRKGTKYTVTFGTHICTKKWFNTKEEANEYINSKPWELIFIGTMIFRDKCKEIANNKK